MADEAGDGEPKNSKQSVTEPFHLGSTSGFTPLQTTLQPWAPSQLTVHASIHTGPLPPAHVLKEYENASPGAAKWILEEAKKTLEHTGDMEKQGLGIISRDTQYKRLLPLIALIMFLGFSTVMSIFANPYLGAAAFVTTLGSVAVAYYKSVSPAQAARPKGEGISSGR